MSSDKVAPGQPQHGEASTLPPRLSSAAPTNENGLTSLADARSALMDGIRRLNLEKHFSRATLKAVDAFTSVDAEWQGPLAWFQPEGTQTQALLDEVVEPPGLRRQPTVYLCTQFGEPAVESTCTCGKSLCPHAAAILVRLQRLSDWPRAMTPWQRWRHTLKQSPSKGLVQSDDTPARTQQTACLLRPASEVDPCRVLAWLVVAAPGVSLHDRDRWTAIEELPPEAALSSQLLLWQARLARGPRNALSSAAGHELHGADGAALLGEWLQAGICYDADTLQPLRHGAPRQPRWEWLLDAQAQRHLRLKPSELGFMRAVELDGLRYLDDVSGEIGELKLPHATWSMIERMPPIPPEDTSARQEWPPHPLLQGIPAPPPAPPLRALRAPLETVVLVGAARCEAQDEYVFYATAWAEYRGCRMPLAQDPWRQSVIRRVAGEFTCVERQVEEEATAQQSLTRADLVALRRLVPDAWRSLSPAPPADALAHRQYHRGGVETFTALDSQLRSLLSSRFRIEYDPQIPFTVLPEETPLQATLREADTPGWTQFQLTAVYEGADIDVLPIVLQGLKRRAFSLAPLTLESRDAHWLAPIGTDRFLPLRLSRLREWLTPLVTYLGTPKPADTVDLPDAQAMALSASLQREDVSVEGPKAATIADTLAALRAAQKSATAAPRTFQGVLRPYQIDGLHWLQSLRSAALGGVLADDMGLGKTVQVIAHLLLESEAGRLNRPALIVASTTLVFNWLDELARFAPSLACINFTGAERTRVRHELAKADVIVVSYALLGNELSVLQNLDYSVLVLDEAQWVKNPFTLTARAVRALRAPHKLALTGTPLENHLGELWAHFDVVMPGYLGDYRSFNRSFRAPIERRQDDRRMATLRQLTAPFILRRTKPEVAPELPPKTETVLRIAMGPDQRALYESLRLSLSRDVRDALAQYTEGESRIVVLSALMRLRQVCCDPRLLAHTDETAPSSAKLEALMGLVRSLRNEDRQVLVFSQFTSMLELISQELTAARLPYAVLTGNTTDRRTPVQRFQSKQVGILLASLKAGGVGLNLTAADAVIHYDPWWNPAVERQAADRAHRLGLEHPVFIYQLLCEDTIEEKIAAMKDQKSDLAHAVLGDGVLRGSPLAEVEIRKLFDLSAARADGA